MKLTILKRYQDGQLDSPSSSPSKSLEAAFEQLIANKYSMYFIPQGFPKILFLLFLQINQ
jgi:hypothetical protein